MLTPTEKLDRSKNYSATLAERTAVIKGGGVVSKEQGHADEEAGRFRVSAQTIVALGQESIRDTTTAVVELVKNAYDADANVVEINISSAAGYIVIRDDGVGMSRKDILQQWLTIGFSAKKRNKVSRKGRRTTGEKGVGRISADRLGRNFQMKTQSSRAPVAGLKLDWDSFRQPKLDLSEVPIEMLTTCPFKVPRHIEPGAFETADGGARYRTSSREITGTEIHITGLRENWNASMLGDLWKALSTLTSPSATIEDFQIILRHDLAAAQQGIVTGYIADYAHSTLTCTCDSEGNISITLANQDGTQDLVKDNWERFVDLNNAKEQIVGPITVEYYYYPRKAATVRDTGFSLSDLKDYLDVNQGVRIYRDNIRVMPYGNLDRPGGDWLGLAERRAQNPAGVGRVGHRIGSNQLVGVLSIGRDTNPTIQDSTAREGLINNESFRALKAFATSALRALEDFVHESYTKEDAEREGGKKDAKDERPPREKAQQLASQLRSLQGDIESLTGKTGKKSESKQREVAAKMLSASSQLGDISDELEELIRQATIFRGLATIGVAATTFGHETMTHLERISMPMVNAANKIRKYIGPDERAAKRLDTAREVDLERVRRWATFALTRVARDKRERRMLDVSALLKHAVADVRPLLKSTGVELDMNIESKIKTRAYPIDMESALLNLMLNAHYFVKRKGGRRKIRVEITSHEHKGKRGFLIAVADSGPGVRRDLREKVWEPLFSTKTTANDSKIGTGLGLAIVDVIVQDGGGWRKVGEDRVLGGASFKVWLPLVGVRRSAT